MKTLVLAASVLWPLFLCSCTTSQPPPSALGPDSNQLEIKAALDSFGSEALLGHIRVLASDEFEGRAPASRGEELTVNYITEQFTKLGLKPGNPDGTYIQKVPLVGITGQPNARFTVAGKTLDLKFPKEYVASSSPLCSRNLCEEFRCRFCWLWSGRS